MEGPCCNGYWFQCSCCLRWELNVFLHLKWMYVKSICFRLASKMFCLVGVVILQLSFGKMRPSEWSWSYVKYTCLFELLALQRHFWRSKLIGSLGWKRDNICMFPFFFLKHVADFIATGAVAVCFLWQPKAANDRHFARPESIFAKSQVALIVLNFIQTYKRLFVSWARNWENMKR